LRAAWDKASNPTGATTILEKWEAGTAEPPHSHPGDDATIVVEGKMKIQFFTKTSEGKLKKDGRAITLNAGQTGYIAAGRIHDAQYVEACKIVYVHSGGFGFNSQGEAPSSK
jgi:quercetin dioxygenase-like cupin family protein